MADATYLVSEPMAAGQTGNLRARKRRFVAAARWQCAIAAALGLCL